MRSTNGGQLGRICQAIDELAACSASADGAAGGPAPAAGEAGGARAGSAGPARRARRENPDIARLAAIWGMVADADPELAKRLPGYLSAAE